MNHKQEELTSADYDRVWAKDEIPFIDSAEGLASLADTLGLRSDWHEPDESDVTATLVNPTYKGGNLFNLRETKIRHLDNAYTDRTEAYLAIYKDGEVKARINIATLLALASGYDSRLEKRIYSKLTTEGRQ